MERYLPIAWRLWFWPNRSFKLIMMPFCTEIMYRVFHGKEGSMAQGCRLRARGSGLRFGLRLGATRTCSPWTSVLATGLTDSSKLKCACTPAWMHAASQSSKVNPAEVREQQALGASYYEAGLMATMDVISRWCWCRASGKCQGLITTPDRLLWLSKNVTPRVDLV